MRYVINLPFPTLSQNAYQRKHFHAQHKWLQVAEMWIRARLNELGLYGITNPGRKIQVTIRRYSNGRLDRGNFIGGCKPVLDALKHEGVIVDDREEWLEDRYEQHPAARGEGHTEIEVSDATVDTVAAGRQPEQLGLLDCARGEGDAMRKCGTCSVCCLVLGIHELGKNPGERCWRQTASSSRPG